MPNRILVPMLLVVATLVGLALLWGYDIWLFIDLYAIILVPVIGSLFALCAFGFREGIAAFTLPFAPEADARALRSAESFFALLGRSYAWFAVFGAIVSLIDMLKNLADRTQVGPRLAVACISLEYAAFLTLLLVIPYRSALKKRLAGIE